MDQLIRWRAIDKMAAQGDQRTLSALEREFLGPQSEGTRHHAIRLLIRYAPERALDLSSTDDPRKLSALLYGFLRSERAGSKLAGQIASQVLMADGTTDHFALLQAHSLIRTQRPLAALPGLERHLDGTHQQRALAARSLVAYRHEAAVPALRRLALDADLNIGNQQDAVQALGRIATPLAAQALIDVTLRGSQNARRAAEQELVRLLGDPPIDGTTERAARWRALIERWAEREQR